MPEFRVLFRFMINYFSTWSWLDDGVLPGLIAIVRACWVWPWLLLIQYALSPGFTEAALPLWGVLLLPVLSFTLARWASRQVSSQPDAMTATAPASARISALEPAYGTAQVPLMPRLFVAFLGIVVAIFVVWWQIYRGELGLTNFVWVERLGDSLIRWPETAIPPTVLLMATGLFLWMRGLLDASRSLTHDTVWQIFLRSIVMMVLYLIIITMADLDRVGQLITSVLVMLAAGMSALAFSSVKITSGLDRALGLGVRNLGVDDDDGSMGVLGGQSIPVINRHWLLSVSVAIGLLMVLGLLLTWLIAPEMLDAALNVLWAIATFVGDIAAYILIGLAYVGAMIFYYLFYQFLEPLLRRLMERLNIDEALLEALEERPEETQEAIEVVEQAPVPDEYRWLGLLIIGLLTLLVFAFAIRRLTSSKVEVLDEERESILSSDLLQDQLKNVWDRLRGRFRNQNPDDPYLALDGEESRRRIRLVYQSLLALATELGQPRDPASTPVEYSSRLARATYVNHGAIALETQPMTASNTSNHEADASRVLRKFYGERFAPQLERITAGYVAARYGDEAPPNTMAADVEAAWREIEGELVQDA